MEVVCSILDNIGKWESVVDKELFMTSFGEVLSEKSKSKELTCGRSNISLTSVQDVIGNVGLLNTDLRLDIFDSEARVVMDDSSIPVPPQNNYESNKMFRKALLTRYPSFLVDKVFDESKVVDASPLKVFVAQNIINSLESGYSNMFGPSNNKLAFAALCVYSNHWYISCKPEILKNSHLDHVNNLHNRIILPSIKSNQCNSILLFCMKHIEFSVLGSNLGDCMQHYLFRNWITQLDYSFQQMMFYSKISINSPLKRIIPPPFWSKCKFQIGILMKLYSQPIREKCMKDVPVLVLIQLQRHGKMCQTLFQWLKVQLYKLQTLLSMKGRVHDIKIIVKILKMIQIEIDHYLLDIKQFLYTGQLQQKPAHISSGGANSNQDQHKTIIDDWCQKSFSYVEALCMLNIHHLYYSYIGDLYITLWRSCQHYWDIWGDQHKVSAQQEEIMKKMHFEIFPRCLLVIEDINKNSGSNEIVIQNNNRISLLYKCALYSHISVQLYDAALNIWRNHQSDHSNIVIFTQMGACTLNMADLIHEFTVRELLPQHTLLTTLCEYSKQVMHHYTQACIELGQKHHVEQYKHHFETATYLEGIRHCVFGAVAKVHLKPSRQLTTYDQQNLSDCIRKCFLLQSEYAIHIHQHPVDTTKYDKHIEMKLQLISSLTSSSTDDIVKILNSDALIHIPPNNIKILCEIHIKYFGEVISFLEDQISPKMHLYEQQQIIRLQYFHSIIQIAATFGKCYFTINRKTFNKLFERKVCHQILSFMLDKIHLMVKGNLEECNVNQWNEKLLNTLDCLSMISKLLLQAMTFDYDSRKESHRQMMITLRQTIDNAICLVDAFESNDVRHINKLYNPTKMASILQQCCIKYLANKQLSHSTDFTDESTRKNISDLTSCLKCIDMCSNTYEFYLIQSLSYSDNYNRLLMYFATDIWNDLRYYVNIENKFYRQYIHRTSHKTKAKLSDIWVEVAEKLTNITKSGRTVTAEQFEIIKLSLEYYFIGCTYNVEALLANDVMSTTLINKMEELAIDLARTGIKVAEALNVGDESVNINLSAVYNEKKSRFTDYNDNLRRKQLFNILPPQEA